MYIIKFGLAPYFRSLLLENLKESLCYSISFDESYNKITKSGQMGMVVRYWNTEKDMVDTRYLSSEFLGKAKANDIMYKFQSYSSDLEKNVNLCFLNLLRELRRDEKLNPLLEIGTCGI